MEEQSSSERSSSARSRARERQQRRRQKQQPVPKRSSTRRQTSPIASENAFSLNKILNMPYVRTGLLGIGALIFMGAVIFAVGLFTRDPVEVVLPNALWVGEEWTFTNHSDEEIQEFVALLRENQIGTVYARVSELNFDGSWTGRPDGQNQFQEVREPVTNFTRQMKQFYPDLNLHGIIGVQSDLAADGYRLDDERTQRVVADFSTQVVGSLGFDGIVLDVQPVWNNDENFLLLLRRVSQTIGNETPLIVAAPPDWTPEGVDVPTPEVIAPGTVWDREYKQRVGLIQPDQIVVRAFNSYLDDAGDYSDWVAYQVSAFADAIAELGVDTRIVVGVPTYETQLPAHDVTVENLQSALVGVQRGIAQAGDMASVVEGVMVYPSWTTTDNDWMQFQSLWLNR